MHFLVSIPICSSNLPISSSKSFLFPNNSSIFLSTFFDFVKKFLKSNTSQVNESETEEAMSEDIVMENEGKNVETSFDIDNDLREHMDYNFILEDEQLHKVLDDDIADIILLKDYSKDKLGFEQFLIDCRQGNMIEILPEINYDKELGLNGLLNEIAKDHLFLELYIPYLIADNHLLTENKSFYVWKHYPPFPVPVFFYL